MSGRLSRMSEEVVSSSAEKTCDPHLCSLSDTAARFLVPYTGAIINTGSLRRS